MSCLKPIDRIQIYTGSADRVTGTTGNFSVQASNQLFHSPSSVYKVFLQQVVMRNSYASSIGAAGATFGIEKSLERFVNPTNNKVTVVPSGTAYTPLTIAIPTGTYNSDQIVGALNAFSNPSGTAPFPGSTKILFTDPAVNNLPCLTATVVVSGVPSSTHVDFSFPASGSAGALLGFGTASAGRTFGSLYQAPGSMMTAAGPLAFYYTLPSGNPPAASIITSLNNQSTTAGSGIVFAQDSTTGVLTFGISGAPGQVFDLDLTQSKQLQSAFGYSAGSSPPLVGGWAFATTQTPNRLLDQAVTCVNVHSSLPTSHFVVAGGQLSLSNLTASIPVLVQSGGLIVYTDLDGANATYEKNQDRLVNLSFRLSDEYGQTLTPSDDWYMIVTVDVFEDIGNQETALLAEANELSKEKLRLDRVALAGVDYTGMARMHDRKRVRTERPMMA